MTDRDWVVIDPDDEADEPHWFTTRAKARAYRRGSERVLSRAAFEARIQERLEDERARGLDWYPT